MGLLDKLKGLFGVKSDDLVPSQAKSRSSTTPLSQPTYENSSEKSTPEFDSVSPTLLEKTGEFMSETGKEIKEQSADLLDAVKEKWEYIDENTKEFREQIKSKAVETMGKIDDFIDAKVSESKEKEIEEQKIDADKDGFADKPISFGQGISEKHGDLFNKAEEWLKKHDSDPSHNSVNSNQSSGIDANIENKKIEPLELPKEE